MSIRRFRNLATGGCYEMKGGYSYDNEGNYGWAPTSPVKYACGTWMRDDRSNSGVGLDFDQLSAKTPIDARANQNGEILKRNPRKTHMELTRQTLTDDDDAPQDEQDLEGWNAWIKKLDRLAIAGAVIGVALLAGIVYWAWPKKKATA